MDKPSDDERKRIKQGIIYNHTGLHSGYNRTPFANAFSYLNSSGGWEFSGPSGDYVNRQTGERMSAAQFNGQFLNPSYLPNTADYSWMAIGTVTIVGNDQPANLYGRVYSDGLNSDHGSDPAHMFSVVNGAAGLGLGVMGDMGIIVDSEGEASHYLTVGFIVGFATSAGAGYAKLPNGTKMSKIQGGGAGLVTNSPIPLVSGEIVANNNNGTVGEDFVGGGINIGIGPGYFVYFSHTFLFTIPEDFWSRPGSRR